MTDNGSSFTSKEFQSFMMKNGIINKRSSPYHPATNCLAERAVQVRNKEVVRSSRDKTIKIPIQISHHLLLSDGRTIKRHVDHIQSRECPPNEIRTA